MSYNTLADRAKVVSSNSTSLNKELEHIRMALHCCHFPTWVLNKLQQNLQCRHYNNEPTSADNRNTTNNNINGTDNNNNRNIFMVVPYIQGLHEEFKRTFNRKGIQVHFKGSNTIKLYSWHLKNRTPNYKRV